MVFFDRVYDDIPLSKVVTDDYQSSFTGTEHLIQAGCKKIAYLVVNKEESIGKTRYLGYKDALEKNGISFDDDLVIDCSNSYDENDVILSNLLQEIKPDGIFASVERLAFSAYYVCHRLKIDIPTELKIVAFCSLHVAPLLAPALSTIVQPAEEIGREAAILLFQSIENGGLTAQPQKIILNSTLIARKSSEK